MALFGSNKSIKKTGAAKSSAAEKKMPSERSRSSAQKESKTVLIRPRITEKAANMTAVNVYAFDIARDATKRDVMLAVKAFYKVNPLKVNVVNTPAKRVKMRRKRGFGAQSAGRKAYVFLKKGEEIQFA